MKKLMLLALLSLGASALAADKVLLETPVSYVANAAVVDSVKTECKLEDMLARNVGAALGKLNKDGVGTVASASEAGDAAVMRLQISFVLGIGGGGWTGPKGITIVTELLEHGQVTRTSKFTRTSMGGLWGGLKGTCAILDRCAVTLAEDVKRWASDPSYKVKDQPEPAEKTAEAKPE